MSTDKVVIKRPGASCIRLYVSRLHLLLIRSIEDTSPEHLLLRSTEVMIRGYILKRLLMRLTGFTIKDVSQITYNAHTYY